MLEGCAGLLILVLVTVVAIALATARDAQTRVRKLVALLLQRFAVRRAPTD